jgi:hypothetical protein
MYRWYENADICYAFLSDVSSATYRAGSLSCSRWFTRGWTLQELIAPKEVIFFSSNWKRLSTKTRLQDKLELITGVPKPILVHREHVSQASIAMRMSWAAKRETTRSEDRAYSLLGLFDINIPLIYGEGNKAFRRLQEEIVRTQPYEHTIYAWGTFTTLGKDPLPKEFANLEDLGVDSKAMPVRTKIEWDEEIAKQPLLGMLADSPADFDGCGRFLPSFEAHQLMTSSEQAFFPPTFMHGGVRLRLRNTRGQIAHHLLYPPIIQLRFASYVFLLVRDSSIPVDNEVVIPMIAWLDDVWGRKTKALISTVRMKSAKEDELFVALDKKQDSWPRHFQSGDILFRWPWRNTVGINSPYTFVFTNVSKWRILLGKQVFLRQGSARNLSELHNNGFVASWIWKKVNSQRCWGITMHRVSDRGAEVGGSRYLPYVYVHAGGR